MTRSSFNRRASSSANRVEPFRGRSARTSIRPSCDRPSWLRSPGTVGSSKRPLMRRVAIAVRSDARICVTLVLLPAGATMYTYGSPVTATPPAPGDADATADPASETAADAARANLQEVMPCYAGRRQKVPALPAHVVALHHAVALAEPQAAGQCSGEGPEGLAVPALHEQRVRVVLARRPLLEDERSSFAE